MLKLYEKLYTYTYKDKIILEVSGSLNCSSSSAFRIGLRLREHWAVLVLGCIWLFVLHARFNRAFRSVFPFVSDKTVLDIFLIVCTQTAFFASFAPDLR